MGRRDTDPNRGNRRVPLTTFPVVDLLGLNDDVPAAPVVQGDEGLRSALERLFTHKIAYVNAPLLWGRSKVLDAVLALPEMRRLLADAAAGRAAQEAVERVRALAGDYEGYVTDRGRPEPGSFDHGLNMAQRAAAIDIRAAIEGIDR